LIRTPDYLVIGHATRDLTPDGGFLVGGTVTYSGLTASRLGLRVAVLTSADPALPLFGDDPSIQVQRLLAIDSTTFENVYEQGVRRQHLRAVAEPLTPADLPTGWEQAPIVHLGPIAQEVDMALIGAFPNALLGITPQGWLRQWDEQGRVSPQPCTISPDLLRAANAVVLSPEDVGGDREQIDFFRQHAPVCVLTIGRDGAIVYQGRNEVRVPSFQANELDPTGAGDVFATAFFIRLYETRDAVQAARFANAAASFVIEGPGASHIPSRTQVEWRLRHGGVV
jgi:hypothetical protein